MTFDFERYEAKPLLYSGVERVKPRTAVFLMNPVETIFRDLEI